MAIDSKRTPDDRFDGLPEWPYAPHYLEDLPGYEGLRLAYVDEGPRDGHVVLCLHGQPSWSYLYRKMIPVFVDAGHRVLAPDWFGFGRSDKPTDDAVYTWDFHHGTMTAFIEAMQLSRVTLVCQDWGGVLGLTLPVTHPDLIARLLIMNTALAVGTHPGKGFMDWLAYVERTPNFDVSGLMRRAIPGASEATAAAYGAPFPDVSYKAGVRRFPALVPISPDMDGARVAQQAAIFWSTKWSGPTFMAVGEQDPVLGPPVMAMMRNLIRGCPAPLMLADQGHFVQESGDQVARAALQAFAV
ncbi:Hydrolase, alpha/beta fold family protein [Enhygromyxa salina]|uniref:Hydrolase, alpha/beta fold family protein n=1 Tax=Enhygromyxa salina TaxID=215803 RepID=A0A0C1ZSS2_9BACT|nr:haloalkane dehalogenase [Enhygromyxa salina]KIG14113.1 Hydrolase, alpha/beta fold family protein [Enhygromyxa salina]